MAFSNSSIRSQNRTTCSRDLSVMAKRVDRCPVSNPATTTATGPDTDSAAATA